MEPTRKDYRAWLKTCLSAGFPAISRDTAARLMAVLYENGNNEAMTHNGKFLADVEYIQNRFGLKGLATPDREFTILFRLYAKELQEYFESHREERVSERGSVCAVVPDWAHELFRERYNMKLL